MKKIIIKWLILLTIFSKCVVCFAAIEAPKVKIYINQFADHPALNATTKGIIDGLATLGYYRGKNLDLLIESAQASVSLSGQIANKFANNKPDIVVGVATISSQSLSKYARENKVKLIFTSVTDPIGASLVKDLKKPGNNTSGVSNFVELGPQLEMFKMLKPGLKKLGFLYNPGEFNSISLIKQLQELCPKYEIELVTMPANKTSEVSQSAIKLAGISDAIFISNDNTALSAIRMVVSAANRQKIPVFVSDTDIVGHGALAALGPNQYEVGLQTADLIGKVLKGEDINNVAVEFPKKTELYLNIEAAKVINLEIPDDLRLKAAKIID
jgi:putative ABC transport system substrate-binding protein